MCAKKNRNIIVHTSQVELMLLTLLLRLTIALSNSFWNMKHEMRSAKFGISANSNRNLKVKINGYVDIFQ